MSQQKPEERFTIQWPCELQVTSPSNQHTHAYCCLSASCNIARDTNSEWTAHQGETLEKQPFPPKQCVLLNCMCVEVLFVWQSILNSNYFCDTYDAALSHIFIVTALAPSSCTRSTPSVSGPLYVSGQWMSAWGEGLTQPIVGLAWRGSRCRSNETGALDVHADGHKHPSPASHKHDLIQLQPLST